MSLDHDFLLLDREVDGEWDLTKFVHDPRALHLHDHFVRYLSDALNWIPTLNPAAHVRQHGLCMWGDTIIDGEGAAIACRVFLAWAELFETAPEVVVLQGSFGWCEDSTEALPSSPNLTQLDGGYERLEFDRDAI